MICILFMLINILYVRAPRPLKTETSELATYHPTGCQHSQGGALPGRCRRRFGVL